MNGRTSCEIREDMECNGRTPPLLSYRFGARRNHVETTCPTGRWQRGERCGTACGNNGEKDCCWRRLRKLARGCFVLHSLFCRLPTVVRYANHFARISTHQAVERGEMKRGVLSLQAVERGKERSGDFLRLFKFVVRCGRLNDGCERHR